MARPGELRVTVRCVGAQKAVRDLHRIRYPFLTPIGRNLPARGSMARELLEVGVHRRRAVRALFAGFGIHHRLDFAPAWRQLQWFALVYTVAMFTIVALLFLGILPVK